MIARLAVIADATFADANRRSAWGIAAMRAIIGFTFLMHGWEKIFSIGIPATGEFFGEIGVPFPTLAAAGVAGVELVGGVALILGILTRWVAVPLAIDMVVAILVVHRPLGYFAADGGYELTLLLLIITLALVLTGSGAFALDRFIGQPKAGSTPGRDQPTSGPDPDQPLAQAT